MKPKVFGRNGAWYVQIGSYPPGYTNICCESWSDAMTIANRRSGQGPESLLSEWLIKAVDFR